MSQIFRHKIYPGVLIEEPKNPIDVTWRIGDSWSHVINDEEGFKSASCALGGDRAFLRQWFEDRLGGHWKVEDSSGREVWSGMIWSMRLVDEGWEQTRSLDDFANYVQVVYQSRVTGGRLTMPAPGTWYSDTVSAAKFGIKTLIQTIGEATAARAGQLGQTQIANHAWPGRSKNKTDAGGTSLSINLRGYMSTLAWRSYNNTTLTGMANCNTVIGQAITAVGQFIKATVLESNAVQFSQYHNRDRIALTLLRDIVSLGNASQEPMSIGVYEDRTLYYWTTPTTHNLIWHAAHPAPVRLDGSIKEPWLIRPGDVIRAPWLIPGYMLNESANRDPTTIQIKETSFTSPYTVSLTGTHDERLDILLNRIQNTKW